MIKRITLLTLAISTAAAEAARLGASLPEESVKVDVGPPLQLEPPKLEQHERRLAVEAEVAERNEYALVESLTDFEDLLGNQAVDNEGGRELWISCPSGEGRLTFELITDRYPEETSWTLTRNSTGEVVAEGPWLGSEYIPYHVYGGIRCLPVGGYVLVIRDSYGDGMCCRYGYGSYSIDVNGEYVIQMPMSGDDFEVKTMPFVIGPYASPIAAPTQSPNDICYQVDITSNVVTTFTYWMLNNNNGDIVMRTGYVPDNNCFPSGDYEFEMKHFGLSGIFGDVEIFINGNLIFSGGWLERNGFFKWRLRQVITVNEENSGVCCF